MNRPTASVVVLRNGRACLVAPNDRVLDFASEEEANAYAEGHGWELTDPVREKAEGAA